MELTMSYNFAYIRGSDLAYPKSPKKPRLSSNPSSQEAREYADALEHYNIAYAEFRDKLAKHTSEIHRREDQFRKELQKEYNLSDAQFAVLWTFAYDDGHSAGYEEVVLYFERYHELVTEYRAASK